MKRTVISLVLATSMSLVGLVGFASSSSATTGTLTTTDDNFTFNEDIEASLPVLRNDFDTSNLPLTITAVSPSNHGATITISADHTEVNFTPALDFNGAEMFTYTVSNGTNVETASVRLTITPVNDNPVANNDNVTNTPGQTLTFSPMANDTDPDGDILSIDSVSQPTDPSVGSTSISGSAITYTPTNASCNMVQFTYHLSDGMGGGATGTVTIRSDCFEVNNDSFQVTEDSSALSLNVLLNDASGNGTLNLVSASTTGTGTVVASLRYNVIIYTPAPDYFGIETLNYTASNGTREIRGTVTITVTNVYDTPVPMADQYQTHRNEPVIIRVLANDIDVDASGAHVSLWNLEHANGRVETLGASTYYIPNNDYCGNDEFFYELSNGVDTRTATVSVTVLCDKVTQHFSLPKKLVKKKSVTLAKATREGVAIAVTASGVCKASKKYVNRTVTVSHKKIKKKVFTGWALVSKRPGNCRLTVSAGTTAKYSPLKLKKTYVLK